MKIRPTPSYCPYQVGREARPLRPPPCSPRPTPARTTVSRNSMTLKQSPLMDSLTTLVPCPPNSPPVAAEAKTTATTRTTLLLTAPNSTKLSRSAETSKILTRNFNCACCWPTFHPPLPLAHHTPVWDCFVSVDFFFSEPCFFG